MASFHIPVWSQCQFTGEGRQVTFSFKFMVWDLFDLATLDRMSIEFNAQFTAGGVPPSETMDDLGKISFASAPVVLRSIEQTRVVAFPSAFRVMPTGD